MLRFGIIGSGPIVRSFAEACGTFPGIGLTAVYSRSLERARDFARSQRLPFAFDSLEDLARCAEVDAVYVASPNSLHCAQSLRMLEAGKHVLCEKPVASNFAEYRAMLDTARARGRVFLEATRNLHEPFMRLLAEEAGTLGTIRRVDLAFDQYSSRYDKFKAGTVENAFNPELSNAALMDIGIYVVESLLYLMGPPEALHSASLMLENGFEGAGMLLARYPGALASLSYSKISDGAGPNLIEGEGGSLLWDSLAYAKRVEKRLRGAAAERLPFARDAHNMQGQLRDFLRYCARGEALYEGAEALDAQGALSWRDFVARLPGRKPSERGEDLIFYQNLSGAALRLMDEVRRRQGIVFPADARSPRD